MAKTPKFWMVYGHGRSMPTYRHNSKDGAIKEAKRLAEQAPGHRFSVMVVVDAYEAAIQPVGQVEIGKPPKSDDPTDDIPF